MLFMINNIMKKHVKSYKLWEQDGKSIYNQPLQVILRFKEEKDPKDIRNRLENVLPDLKVDKIENEGNKEFAFLALVGTNDEELRAEFPDADIKITRLPGSSDDAPKMLGV